MSAVGGGGLGHSRLCAACEMVVERMLKTVHA